MRYIKEQNIIHVPKPEKKQPEVKIQKDESIQRPQVEKQPTSKRSGDVKRKSSKSSS
jgi:hypothetical protein|tara:strand:+ start:40 stop:210 length:171 start_codon:yes stop_codon:yes gene_type:complete